jgi:predicted RNA-binding Zn-ribbon protein involved in translation (DUF1610 family)
VAERRDKMKTFNNFLEEHGFNEHASSQLRRAVLAWLQHRLPPSTSAETVDEALRAFEAYLLAPKENYIRRLEAGHEADKKSLYSRINELTQERETYAAPIHLLLTCPMCGERHIDAGEFATKPHHTHSCQFCGMTWRPAIVATVGVQFLPGFKDELTPAPREKEREE